MQKHHSGLPHPDATKAYENLDFLHSAAARNIRVQCEFTEPDYRLRKEGIRNTLVFFGSARTLSEAEALENLAKIRRETANSSLSTEEKAKLLGKAEMALAGSAYYEASRQLAKELTQWSMRTFERVEQRYHICSGGGPGIMEAANRGASEAGGKSVGLGISLPFEQYANPWVPEELNFEFHYFFVRKYWFLYLAKALVVFPGGFGTMDELFEMLTLIQTGKTKKNIPIVLFGSPFWKELFNLDVFLKWGLISPEDMHLFVMIDTVEEARDYIIREVLHHRHADEGRQGAKHSH